jgi:hypothetical protein
MVCIFVQNAELLVYLSAANITAAMHTINTPNTKPMIVSHFFITARQSLPYLSIFPEICTICSYAVVAVALPSNSSQYVWQKSAFGYGDYSVVEKINPHLPHRRCSQRMNKRGLCSRRISLHLPCQVMVDQALGHLAAGAVMSADEEDPFHSLLLY